MKKTRKILLGALMAICMSVAMICGATYALFTSEAGVNIAVTSGSVSVTATVGEPAASLLPDCGVVGNPNVTATKVDGGVRLENMTPGDKVDFTIHVANVGSTAAKYRTKVVCEEGEFLMTALQISVGDVQMQSVYSYASAYADLAAKASFDVPVTISFPVRGDEIDNRYNGVHTLKIAYIVEAVQANAAGLATEEEIVKLRYVTNTAEAQAALDDAVANETIVLAKGAYEKLHIRPSHRSVYHEGGYSGYPDYYVDYDRFLDDITIRGEEGAVVCGIVNDATLYNVGGGPVVDKPVVGDGHEGHFSRAAYFIRNLTIENLTLVEAIEFTEGGWAPVEIDGLQVLHCETATDNEHNGNSPSNKLLNNRGKLKNLVVRDCKVTNRFQGLFVQSVENALVENCVFDTTVHNGIAIQTGSKGEIVLRDNVICGATDRAIRFDVFNEGSIEMANNVIYACGDKEGQLAKATSVAEGVSVSIHGNYWDGKTTDLDKVIVNFGVVDTDPAASTDGFAAFESMYVKDAEAFAAALTAGGTVLLGEDVTIDAPITLEEGTQTTLHLNGKTLTYTSATGDLTRPVIVSAGAELTIYGEDGVMYAEQDKLYGLIDNFGTLTMYGGHYELKSNDNSGILRLREGSVTRLYDVTVFANGFNAALYNNGDCIVEGGTYTSYSSNKGNWAYCFQNAAGGTMVVDGATVRGIQGGISAHGGNMTIHDCDVLVGNFGMEDQKGRSHYALYVNGSYDAAYCTVNGGTFVAEEKYAVYCNNMTLGDGGECLYENLEIYGGTFKGNWGAICFNDAEGGDLAIFGGTFNTDIDKWTADGYAAHKKVVDGETVYVVTATAYDFTDAEQEWLFCPKCSTGEGEHSEHLPYVTIHDGVADVTMAGAWLSYALDYEHKVYTLSYDVDLTALGEGAYVAMNYGDTAWQADSANVYVGFKNVGGVYELHNTQLGNGEALAEVGAKVHVEITVAEVDGKMQVTTKVGDVTYVKVGHTVNFYWDVYTMSGEGAAFTLSDFALTSVDKQ